jgi:hypothetical protein
MQPSQTIDERAAAPRNLVARPEAVLLARFLGKFALDILPAALASVIGGFLFTQYQAGHAVSRTATAQVTPASAEMMAMVRDEHAMMMDYLKSQMAAEKSREAAEDAARAAAIAKAADDKAADEKAAEATPVADAAAPPRLIAVTSRAAPAHIRKPVAIAAAPSAPLVIAQADQSVNQQNPAQSDGPAPSDRLARDPDSLLAKTLDFKDHVVAATRQVVGAIGNVFASMGERIGGAAPTARQFSSSS